MRIIAMTVLLAACDGDGTAEGESTATGRATYEDAQSGTDGVAQDPQPVEPQPNDDPMTVEVLVEGTGTFEVTEPECELDQATGAFEGLYQGEAEVDEEGLYVATLSETEATFQTPSGCTLPDLSIGAVTDVVVRGELSATQENCETYCAAKARSEAEATCEGDSDEASCRAEEETTYAASCETACTGSTTHVIVAETSLGASALTDLDLAGLGGTALGTVEADLTFDHVETESGEEVEEAP